MIRFAVAALALAAAALPAAAQPDFFFQSARRAWLGFSYETTVTRRDGDVRHTLVIRDVVSASPAERAGLQVGDTLVAVNDINATDQFISSLAYSLEPGDVVRLRIRRAGAERTVEVEAASPPADYMRISPRVGILSLHADSLRGRMRVLIDSTQIRLDSLRLPNIFIYRDSLRALRAFQLDSMMLDVDSLNARFRLFGDSAWRTPLDSVRGQWFMRPGAMRSYMDSAGWQADSTFLRQFGPRAFAFHLDSLRPWRELDPTPYAGITVWGARAVAGAELTELNPELGEYFGAENGVLVVRVPDGTPAADAGLAAGDVIVAAGERSVGSIADLRRAIERAGRDEPVRLDVIRKRQRIQIELER